MFSPFSWGLFLSIMSQNRFSCFLMCCLLLLRLSAQVQAQLLPGFGTSPWCVNAFIWTFTIWTFVSIMSRLCHSRSVESEEPPSVRWVVHPLPSGLGPGVGSRGGIQIILFSCRWAQVLKLSFSEFHHTLHTMFFWCSRFCRPTSGSVCGWHHLLHPAQSSAWNHIRCQGGGSVHRRKEWTPGWTRDNTWGPTFASDSKCLKPFLRSWHRCHQTGPVAGGDFWHFVLSSAVYLNVTNIETYKVDHDKFCIKWTSHRSATSYRIKLNPVNRKSHCCYDSSSQQPAEKSSQKSEVQQEVKERCFPTTSYLKQ